MSVLSMLRTATGKTYPCNFMGVATGYTALYVKVEIDLNELLAVFQDPNETEVLEWIGDSGCVVRTETGYTVFTGFDIMKGECPIRIRMEKGL